MRKFAALGLAGLIAAGSLAAATTSEAAPFRRDPPPVGAFVAGTILGLGIAAATQPTYDPYPGYGYYQPGPSVYYEPAPQAYYQPAPRRAYYSNSWCQQQNDYNPYTGVVTEANGSTWQCSPPH